MISEVDAGFFLAKDSKAAMNIIKTKFLFRGGIAANSPILFNHLQSFPKMFSSSRINRGLEEYFDSPSGWTWTDTQILTGRAWLQSELRLKSFNDLHSLWWLLLKERNKLESQKQEARRFQVFFPNSDRLFKTKLTMNRIKNCLTERRIAYLQAKSIVEKDIKRREIMESGLAESEIEVKLSELDSKSVAFVGRRAKKQVKQSRPNKKIKDKRSTSWTIA